MITRKPQVTAVIVTYESRDMVGYALDALHVAYKAGFADVVVVDNASADVTADFVAENYPWVILIRSDKNLGYGRGCNLGFKSVQTPYVLILNPDAIVDHVALNIMVEFMERTPTAGIVAPATRDDDDKLEVAGMMTTPGSLFCSATGFGDPYPDRRPIMPGEAPFKTPWVCGAIMLIRSELFRDLEGFDPRFFLYFEETDLCRRVAAQGVKIWAVGEAFTRHSGAASSKSAEQSLESSCIVEHFYRSRFYYLIKHFGWFKAISVEGFLYVLQAYRVARFLLSRNNNQTQVLRRPIFRLPDSPGANHES